MFISGKQQRHLQLVLQRRIKIAGKLHEKLLDQ